MKHTAVVVPNWNGEDSLSECLDSLLIQTTNVIVVENGSKDNSLELLKSEYPNVKLVVNDKNLGFAGGVNSGIRAAIADGFEYVTLFNNDAVADNNWLKSLEDELNTNSEVGIATCKLLTHDGNHIDSTGDIYTVWGLPYPRGRNEIISSKYDNQRDIFAASGGASIYRIKMLEEIGLFDEDFFAYYEDVDISFRAQLAGWKVRFVPDAIAYHQIGATSSKIHGFTTLQTMKNLPLLLIKNVPRKYVLKMGVRLLLVQSLFLGRAITSGRGIPAIKGSLKALVLIPRKAKERRKIQLSKKVSDEYIWSIVTHDLPPNAHALRSLRQRWWKLTRRNYVEDSN